MVVPLKVKYFVWLVIRDRIVVRDKLQELGIMQGEEHLCPFCNAHKEDNIHLLCTVTKCIGCRLGWLSFGI